MTYPIKLVALDLDGTLLDEELRIGRRVECAIAATLARGVHVTIATGRAFASARPFAQRLGITTPLITYQGGVITDPRDATVLRAEGMTRDVALAAARRALAEDVDISFYVGETIYTRQRRWPQEFYDRWFGLPMHVTPDLTTILDSHPALKFIIIAEPPEADVIEARWKTAFDGRLIVVRSHRLFVEGNPPGVSKGAALAWLAERLAVPREGVLAMGDNDNDRSMVEWAGVGVAMGDGAPSLQAVADWVAPPLHADGVAAALDRFVLGGKE